MHSLLLIAALSSITTTVLADGGFLAGGPSPQREIMRRQAEELACASSVISELDVPLPTNQDLENLATESSSMFACQVTAPASLSEAYSSWGEEISTWLEGVEAEAADQTDCGAEWFTLDFRNICSETRTIYFTDSANRTDTQTMEGFPVPTGTVHVGAATRQPAAVGASLALVLMMAALL